MQAAEMLCNTMGYHLVFLISLAIGHVHSAPLQTLPNIAGYIPVYIRHGDQPLEEINPQLAEAFHENSAPAMATVLPNVNGPTDSSLVDEASKVRVETKRVRKEENNASPMDKMCKGSLNKDVDAELKKYKEFFESVIQIRPLTEEEEEDLENIKANLKEKLKMLEIQKSCATKHYQTSKPSTNEEYDEDDKDRYDKANRVQQRVKDIFEGANNIRNQRYPDRYKNVPTKIEVPQEILDKLEKKQILEKRSK